MEGSAQKNPEQEEGSSGRSTSIEMEEGATSTTESVAMPTEFNRQMFRGESSGESSQIVYADTEGLTEKVRLSSSLTLHSDSSNSCGEVAIVMKEEVLDDIQENVINSTARRKMVARPAKDKICLVCGDKALGYNFNAISCESCKAFFRRNAGKTIRGRCEGKCDVTIESRSYCKRCRLQKCFTVGMKRDLILSDTQKQQRKSKIHCNRLRRMGVPIPEGAEEETIQVDEGSSEEMGALNPELQPTNTHVIAAEADVTYLDQLKPESRVKIEEVIKAFSQSFDAPIQKQVISNPTNADFLNMADGSVRRLVKMGKNLAKFRSISQEDQVALLKGSVLEVLILRSIKMFDRRTMGWHVTRSGTEHTVSASVLSENKDSVQFFEQYQRFATGVMMSIRGDNILLMLLMVMSVFSPDRPNVKNKPIISEIQEGYARLLHEYINTRFPNSDASLFPKVLQKLTDIRDLDETHAKMLLHMDVDRLEPLIVEIFDLSA